MKKKHKVILLIIYLLAGVNMQAQDMHIYKDGIVVFEANSAIVDSVALENEKTKLTFYDTHNVILYSDFTTGIDSITFTPVKPVADILDVIFKTDGTAEDISPMKNTVTTVAGGALSTYYSSTYDRFVARFTNTWGGATSGYYKIDYSNNQAFKDALANGHTLEALVMANYEAPIKEVEAKFFSSHEAGGTGLMVCKAFRGINGENELSFLPHVGGDWRFAASGVVPVPQTYYHMVGIWNKQEGTVSVYLNGELMNSAEAVGEFTFPKDGSNWFGIGCDAGPTAQLGWNGDVVLARIYDAPLTQQDVAVLWNEIKKMQDKSEPDMVTDVDFFSGLAVMAGQTFPITGNGFETNDKMRFLSITDENNDIIIDCELTNSGVNIVIPSNFSSGQYRMMLIKANKVQDLGLITFEVVEEFPNAPDIVAHRGYWDTEGSAQNSLAAIRNAQKINIYGSELDVWLTTDGHLVINHDAAVNGITIQNSTYEQVKGYTLSNGEYIPQLQDCLELIKNNDTTKLFIEVKTHNSAEKNNAVVAAIIQAVQNANVKDRVHYIAFSLNICKELVRLEPTANVAYLNGDLTPGALHDLGINGIHYSQTIYRNNPQWITDAKNLGMIVNVQGCNTVGDMADMINRGADLISTDKPLDALRIRKYYIDNQSE